MNFNPLDQAPSALLTPRQDRIEATITRVLRSGGTRSSLRAAVDQYVDLLRAQGVPGEVAIVRLEALAEQATSSVAVGGPVSVGDSAADRIGMIVRWCARRYYRAD
jgi:ribosomal protein S28E/S33